MNAGTPQAGGTTAPPCAQRLRRSSDVRAVFASRRVTSSRLMVVHVRRRADAGPARATVVAGKKVGSAVRRNRAKRRLRSALQQACLMPGLDLVIVARAAVHDAPFAQLRDDLRRLVSDAGRRA